MLSKIGFGGGCHWCTEAVFQSLIGVENVEQGWIASEDLNDTFSEAVIVTFNSEIIPLETLTNIHLHTHKSTSNHSMRSKYRSAVYYFKEPQKVDLKNIITQLQSDFNTSIITQILPFKAFKPSREAITNYYYNNPYKPFCEQFINPKLKLILHKFSKYASKEKLQFLIKD
ncbi:peptide methionine sulfoxide reductase [Flavobacteriaceae bacterium AU392]|nr:peptide methionine sulfoxide reductase [Flavobacteriaceae bacterium]RKM81659.1 peptide methionine sulfoxide reductase [Flavobacteriaceae bacterium AU392]